MAGEIKEILASLQDAGITGWGLAAVIPLAILALKSPEFFKIWLEHSRESKRINADLAREAERFRLDVERKRSKMITQLPKGGGS